MRVVLTIGCLFISITANCQLLSTPLEYWKPFDEWRNVTQKRVASSQWEVAFKKASANLYQSQDLTFPAEGISSEFAQRFYVLNERPNSLEIITLDKKYSGWCKRTDVLLSANTALSSSIDYGLFKVLIAGGVYELHPTWNPENLKRGYEIQQPGVFHLLDQENDWVLINNSPRMSENARWIRKIEGVIILPNSIGHKAESASEGLYGGYPVTNAPISYDQGKWISLDKSPSTLVSASLMTSWEVGRIITKMEDISYLDDASSFKEMCLGLGAQEQDQFLPFFQKYMIGVQIFDRNERFSDIAISQLDRITSNEFQKFKAYCHKLEETLSDLDFAGNYEVAWIPKEVFLVKKENLNIIPSGMLLDSPKNLTVLYMERAKQGYSELEDMRTIGSLQSLLNPILKQEEEVLIVHTCTSKSNLCTSYVNSGNLETAINAILNRNDNPSIDWRSRQKAKNLIRQHIYSELSQSKINNIRVILLVNKEFTEFKDNVSGISDHNKLIGDFSDEMSEIIQGKVNFLTIESQFIKLENYYRGQIEPIKIN